MYMKQKYKNSRMWIKEKERDSIYAFMKTLFHIHPIVNAQYENLNIQYSLYYDERA